VFRLATLIALIFLFILAGCEDPGTIYEPIYTGKNLSIGVVGEIPSVREEDVEFKLINLNDLHSKELSVQLDAVFIMKENLRDAADSQYASVYKNAGIPFFFIESEKSYYPFIDEETSYDNFPNLTSGDYAYATGFYQVGDKIQSWRYGFNKNELKENHILDAYSHIFNTIGTLNK